MPHAFEVGLIEWLGSRACNVLSFVHLSCIKSVDLRECRRVVAMLWCNSKLNLWLDEHLRFGRQRSRWRRRRRRHRVHDLLEGERWAICGLHVAQRVECRGGRGERAEARWRGRERQGRGQTEHNNAVALWHAK